MATIADNIESMAAMVARIKKTHHLTETTVLRIVDMNFALAQSAGMETFSGEEPFPIDPDFSLPEGDVTDILVPFPDNEADIEAVEESDDDERLATTAQLEN